MSKRLTLLLLLALSLMAVATATDKAHAMGRGKGKGKGKKMKNLRKKLKGRKNKVANKDDPTADAADKLPVTKMTSIKEAVKVPKVEKEASKDDDRKVAMEEHEQKMREAAPLAEAENEQKQEKAKREQKKAKKMEFYGGFGGKTKQVFREALANGTLSQGWAKVDAGKVDESMGRPSLHVFNDGERHLTTKAVNAEAGASISFSIKYGPQDGGAACVKKEEERVKEEKAKVKAEQDKKEQEKKRLEEEENKRKMKCINRPPCSGHGKGIYDPDDQSCTCECDANWQGDNCERGLQWGSCHTVGDPHPHTFDHLSYNIYDTGEFLFFRRPDSNEELHVLTEMLHPSIAGNAAVALQMGDERITLRARRNPGNNHMKIRISCGKDIEAELVSGKYPAESRAFKTEGGALLWFAGGSYFVRTPERMLIRINQWRSNSWDPARNRWNCRNCQWYLNVFITILQPRDGKTEGMCGNFDGNRNNDVQNVIGSFRPRGQPSTQKINEFRQATKGNSFFKCDAKTLKKMAKELKDQGVDIKKEKPEDDATDAELKGDESKVQDGHDMIDEHKAAAMCQKLHDASARENCIEDLRVTGEKKMLDVAEEQEEEEKENDKEKKEEEEKVEEQEIEEEDARREQDDDYGVHLEFSKAGGEWKKLRMFSLAAYSELFTQWRPMTAQLPQEAFGTNVAFRFKQKKHTCQCCDDWAVSDMTITSGGSNIAITAEENFELWIDGIKVGQGASWEDTYKYAVNQGFQTVAIKATGKEGRMGILGQFGDSIVTSSAFKCTDEEMKGWQGKDFDDNEWPYAAEEGDNGIIPWGVRKGISSKAKWIWTHDAYKEQSTVYCRLNVKDVKDTKSDSSDSSRWSCKSGEHRNAPHIIFADDESFNAASVKSGKEEKRHIQMSALMTTGMDKGEETRQLIRINTKQIVTSSKEGALLKRALLRLYVVTPGKTVQVCPIMKEWDEALVSWADAPPAQDQQCMEVDTKEKGWVTLDISDHFRKWVDEPSKNFGLLMKSQEANPVELATPFHEEERFRPRLSLTCHGDKVDAEKVL